MGAIGDDGAMSPGPPPLRIRLFGDPAVCWGDGRTVALERRAAALLALAALEPGISRLRVATLLWPDSSDPRRNLRQQLLRFRQQFGHPLVEGDAMLTLPAGLLVRPDAATAAATAAPGSPRPTLLAGLDFDEADPLAQWLRAQRSAQQAQFAQALDEALARAEAEQRLGDAIDLARRRLAEEPTAETHHRTLIRLHYLNQDSPAARAAFDALQHLLQREFGAAPSAETAALMQLVDQPPIAQIAHAPTRAWSTALQRPPRLVGRARELQAIRITLGEHRALLPLGEAGMGKSRLLAEGLDGTPRQLSVKAQAGDAGVPYATLARLLRRLLEGPGAPRTLAAPDAPPKLDMQAMQDMPGTRAALARLLPEMGLPNAAMTVTLPPSSERLLLQNAVAQVIQHAQLQALAVDDLHFADAASLEMLTALVGAEAPSAMAWLFTQRPGEGSPAATALRDTLEEARRLSCLDIAPLDAPQMVELVRSLKLPEVDAEQLGPRLLRHSGGNPLFALETLKHMLLPGSTGLAMPQPATVGTLIDRRLKRLSDAAWALARVAAIAGADFSIALAEHATGSRAVELATAWAELESAHVLRGDAFAHDLVHEAVLRSIPTAIEQHLHAQLAHWLVQHQSEPARVAAHWQAGGEPQRAAQAWVEAGHAAERCLRWRESMQCFEQAAALFATLGDAPAQHQALLGAVDQAALIDLPLQAYTAMVERLVSTAPDGAARAKAMIYRLRTLEMTGNMEGLLHDAGTAVALAQAEQLKQTEAYARVGRGTARVYVGQLEAALNDFSRVSEIGAEIEDGELEGMGHSSNGAILVRMGRSAQALEAFETARALYVRHECPMRLALVDQQRALVHLGHGHPLAALAAGDSALRGAMALEAAFDFVARCSLPRAMALRHLGRYAESMAMVEALLDQGHLHNSWVVDPLHLELAQSCVHLGRIDLAVRHLAQARAPGRLQPAEQQRALCVQLQLRSLGHEATQPLPDLPEPGGEPRRRCELLRARAALAPAEERAVWLDEALQLARQFELIDERLTAQAALAQHLLQAGQTQAARELIRVALHDETVVPAGYPPAVAATAQAVLAASGEHQAARRVLSTALDWIDRCATALAPEFRTSFLERNPVNRALLQAGRAV
jgi:DNA-binding SARP family transcriptional activator/tetratricopeptide (TPR) repeat protein